MPLEPIASSLVTFVRRARGAGLHVGTRETLDAMRLAEAGLLWERERAFHSLRSVLCQRREDWERFPTLFRDHWRPLRQGDGNGGRPVVNPRVNAAAGISGSVGPLDDDTVARIVEAESAQAELACGGAGDYEVLAHADFRFVWDDDRMRQLQLWADRLAARVRLRLTRRYRPGRRGRRVDFRRTIRASLRYGGWPMATCFRRRREQSPRLLLFVDVSQSMEIYSYFFLRFARALAGAFDTFDAYAFHTQLVSMTDVLTDPDSNNLNERLQTISSGWHGGTRISDSLVEFGRLHGSKQLDPRTVVVIVSDGYDTAPAEELEQAVAGIARRARRVLWLNPLLGRPGARERTMSLPVEQGLKRALRHVDVYAPAHNLESLRKLEHHLAR